MPSELEEVCGNGANGQTSLGRCERAGGGMQKLNEVSGARRATSVARVDERCAGCGDEFVVREFGAVLLYVLSATRLCREYRAASRAQPSAIGTRPASRRGSVVVAPGGGRWAPAPPRGGGARGAAAGTPRAAWLPGGASPVLSMCFSASIYVKRARRLSKHTSTVRVCAGGRPLSPIRAARPRG